MQNTNTDPPAIVATGPDAGLAGISIRDLLEFTSDAILAVDKEWRYTYVNHSAELLFRRKRTDMLAREHWALYPELLGTPAEVRLRQAVQSRSPTRFEQYIPGLYAWHSVLAVPSEGGLLLFCRDISDRVRALNDEAVRGGLRNILEDIPVAITLTRGPQHRIDLQNAFSRRLLKGRDVEGMTVENAMPETRAQGFIDILDQVYEEGKPFIGKELPLSYDPDGAGGAKLHYFDVSYQPIFDTAGKVDGIVHIGVDVTTRMEEQRLLQRFAAERDATLRQLTEGVIVADELGRISFVNDAARRLHGVARLGVSVDDYTVAYSLWTEDGRPYPNHDLPLARAVLLNEQVTGARWRIRRPDGSEVLVEGSAQPIHDDARRTIAHVVTMREV